ncbi:MAG TPA: hypothetical protein DCS31_09890 [Candidatus Competibacteraceae bacterium]|nr:hypothetical protein [Candidatus Competibacteraceae bacterium]
MCLQQLALAVLNSLGIQMAVFDEQGVILYVNRSWISFGQSNGLDSDDQRIGRSYCNRGEMGIANMA